METFRAKFKDVVNTLQDVWDKGLLNDLSEITIRDCAYELAEMYTDKVDELSEKDFNELTEMFVDAVEYVEL